MCQRRSERTSALSQLISDCGKQCTVPLDPAPMAMVCGCLDLQHDRCGRSPARRSVRPSTPSSPGKNPGLRARRNLLCDQVRCRSRLPLSRAAHGGGSPCCRLCAMAPRGCCRASRGQPLRRCVLRCASLSAAALAVAAVHECCLLQDCCCLLAGLPTETTKFCYKFGASNRAISQL